MPGSSYIEVKKTIDKYYALYQHKTKRQPYIRSAYFLKQKVFFNLFWVHLFDKSHKVRFIRLKYLPAGIDLIEHSRNHPFSVDNQNSKSETLHRFYGLTKDKSKFIVQIKQIKRSGKLYLMSIYPE